MKYFLISIALFALTLSFLRLDAQLASPAPPHSQDGMEFFHGTWKEALAEAKAQKKLVFVDIYAEWCGPCKMMARNTFTDPAVGKFFNANFINVKIDAEKGEGPALASAWRVTAYPTYMFVNHLGDEVYRSLGYMAPPEFIEQGKEAAKPSRNTKQLKKEVESGDNDPAKLLAYALELQQKNEGYQETASRFFASQKPADLTTETGWKAISALTTDADSREFQLLMQKRAAFEKIGGAAPVAAKIHAVFSQAVATSLAKSDEAGYKKSLIMAQKFAGDNGQEALRMEMQYAEGKQNWAGYTTSTMAYFKKFVVADAAQLNAAAANILAHSTDATALKTATEWMRQSLALKDTYASHHLYASLLAKTGDGAKAMSEAKRALQFETITPEERRNTQQLLQSLTER